MEDEDEEEGLGDEDDGVGASASGKPAITDKEFYKAMQKLKDRGTNAVPPKKSASAYIIFGKEVSWLLWFIVNPTTGAYLRN